MDHEVGGDHLIGFSGILVSTVHRLRPRYFLSLVPPASPLLGSVCAGGPIRRRRELPQGGARISCEREYTPILALCHDLWCVVFACRLRAVVWFFPCV